MPYAGAAQPHRARSTALIAGIVGRVSAEAVQKTLVLLAFAGLAGVALTAVGAVLQGVGVGRLGSRIARLVDGAELGLAWVVALVATAGSLYFSEVADYIPCELCWFQRIGMYPLVIVLFIAMLRNDRWIWPYALALSVAGLAVSVYHYQLEWFPEQSTICSSTASVPCTVVWFRHWEVGTIPFLAGSAFLAIGCLLVLAALNERRASATDADAAPPAP